MRNKIILNLIAISIFLNLLQISCNSPNNSLKNTAILSLDTAFRMKINAKIPFRAYVSQWVQISGKSYYMRENRTENSIDVFEWDDKNHKYSHSIYLPKSAPNSVSIYSFYYHNKDTIFIIPFFSTKITIVNDKGQFVSKFDVPIHFKNSRPNMYRASNDALPFFCNNILSLTAAPNINYTYEPDKANSDNIVNNINLLNDSIWVPDISYPSSYLGKLHPSQRVYRTFNSRTKRSVFSFSYDHNLFVADFNKIVEKHKVKSKYFDKIYHFSKYDEFKRGRDRIMHNMYQSLKYDKYKNVYYRILALKGNEQFYNKVNVVNERFFRPFVVMLVDSAFNVVDELKLPAQRYNISEFFVDKHGLWISENNPENPNFDENFLSFRLITFDKKKLSAK